MVQSRSKQLNSLFRQPAHLIGLHRQLVDLQLPDDTGHDHDHRLLLQLPQPGVHLVNEVEIDELLLEEVDAVAVPGGPFRIIAEVN